MEFSFSSPIFGANQQGNNMPLPATTAKAMLPQALLLTDGIAQMLWPTSTRHNEAIRVFVARRLPPPSRSQSNGLTDKDRLRLIRRVLVTTKSEASNKSHTQR